MTLMDESCVGITAYDLLSNPLGRDRPSVSVVIPVDNTSDVTALLARLPGLEGEVILVGTPPADADMEAARALHWDVRFAQETGGGDEAALRAGFAAARGEYIVVIDGDGDPGARDVERFLAALHAGCGSTYHAAA